MQFPYLPLAESTPFNWPKSRLYISFPLLCVLLVSLCFNLATAYLWFDASSPANPLFPQAVYSPAQSALSYRAIKFHSGFGANMPIYDQPPSDAVDNAWKSLYKFAYSKIPRSQAQFLANKTYPILGDEPRTYMLALDVFHQLHCLDEIRKAMNPDYYPHTAEGINTSHMQHCLSSLRQSIMCASDITPIVWQWSEGSHAAKERSDVLHTCRDFGRIHDWAQAHFAGAMQNMSVYIADDLFV
ncbi:hypothetical protein MIND_00446100 [Mycena indigotica]|uniref:Cyclochlorotine biosynthesis protein O n=1 Tax=Mycena indigotica TaxID=2126181 RepID=A0A8H6SWG3_9AGAR|nr:uncharacterized protein MIND_00446100 [Mycena indigotica]KAF7306548.1 hypothetical protein MIND_00446100 [Mycena indigotica]